MPLDPGGWEMAYMKGLELDANLQLDRLDVDDPPTQAPTDPSKKEVEEQKAAAGSLEQIVLGTGAAQVGVGAQNFVLDKAASFSEELGRLGKATEGFRAASGVLGKGLALFPAFVSSQAAITNPTTGNYIEAGINIGLFIASGGVVEVIAPISEVTGITHSFSQAMGKGIDDWVFDVKQQLSVAIRDMERAGALNVGQ